MYVSIEIYRSIATYKLHLTTTEINKINSEAIQFPSVTFCNFNRFVVELSYTIHECKLSVYIILVVNFLILI